MPTLHLSAALLDELHRACAATHPREACGLLLGRHEPREGKGPKLVALRLHPARNVHASCRDRFELSPDDLVAADSAARDAGLEIVGVYHSHPDAEPVPSTQDRDGAQEAWPSVIVATRARAEPVARCWELHGGEMLEQKICIC